MIFLFFGVLSCPCVDVLPTMPPKCSAQRFRVLALFGKECAIADEVLLIGSTEEGLQTLNLR